MNFDETKNDFRKIRQLRKIVDISDAEFNKKEDTEKALILKLKKVELKLTYKYDFYRFIVEVLDAESQGEQPVKLAPVHRRLCRHIRRCFNRGRNCFIRLPRYHLKTQICTIDYRIWRVVTNPEICAVIVSGTLELSKDTARSIKHALTNNKKLTMLYPEVLPSWLHNERRNKWAETEFNVARNGNYAQASVEAFGVDATVTGKHFSEISFDDIVTDKNSTTPEQCEKIIKSYKHFLSIINQKFSRKRIPIMVVGTNYTDHDLYQFISQPEISSQFESFTQIVWDENGDPIWPQQYTKEIINKIAMTQGSYIFATQYLLDPVPEDQQEFKRNWIKIYSELPKDTNQQDISLTKLMMVDPITAKPTSSSSHDRGVILAIGWDQRKNIYILDYTLYTRAKESELFDGIFAMSDKWGIQTVLWESVAYQAQGKINLEEKATERHKRLRVVEVTPAHRDKDFRIRTLIPHMERGQISIRYWMHELISELVRFPYGKTRDIIDALAYGIRYILQGHAHNMWRLERNNSSTQQAWYSQF